MPTRTPPLNRPSFEGPGFCPPAVWLARGLALALIAGCGGGGGSTAGAATPGPVVSCPIPTTPANPTFAADVYPLLHSPTCGSSTISCHGGAGAQGHLDYSGTAAEVRNLLLTQPPSINLANWAIVKPGESSLSWLYEKVHPASGGQPGLAAGRPTGSQMPLGGALCPATTDTIQRWIDQGANP